MTHELDIIIDKLRSGDETFYKSIFYQYYKVLTYFANKYVNDLETSKEIVQELFVKLYEKRYTIKIETSFKSYLFKAVYNSCINHINQTNVREHHHQQIKSLGDDRTDFLDETIHSSELEHKIYSEIEKLPLQCKRIFKLNRFEGISNADIAEQLGLSKRTVETQISKALRILRSKLSDVYLLLFMIVVFLII